MGIVGWWAPNQLPLASSWLSCKTGISTHCFMANMPLKTREYHPARWGTLDLQSTQDYQWKNWKICYHKKNTVAWISDFVKVIVDEPKDTKKKKKDFCVHRVNSLNTATDTVKAGLQLFLRISRQMAPRLLILWWQILVRNITWGEKHNTDIKWVI